jgi:hypothetical protein
MKSIGVFLETALERTLRGYARNWRITIYAGAVMLIAFFAGLLSSNFVSETTSYTGFQLAGFLTLLISALILSPIMSIWIANALMLLEQGKEDSAHILMGEALRYVPGSILLSIVTTCVTVFAFILALILPSIPLIAMMLFDIGTALQPIAIFLTFIGILLALGITIYLGVTLSLAPFAYIASGSPKRPLHYLVFAHRITKKRFFAVAIRMLLLLLFIFIPAVLLPALYFDISKSIILGIENTGIALRLAEILDYLISLLSIMAFTPPVIIGFHLLLTDILEEEKIAS